LASIGKSFLIREKWRFHLGVLTRLEAIKLDLDTATLAPSELVKAMKDAMATYSADLPIVARER